MRRKWGSIVKPLVAFAVVAGMVAATPILSGVAKAIDLDSDCSVTVLKPLEGELKEDLADVDLTVDLYKVADAKATKGIDAYSLTLLDAYSDLSLDNLDTAKAQVELEQAVAEIAIGGQTPVATGKADEEISGLSAGLYLAVTRGTELTDVSEYLTTVTTLLGDNESTETSIATLAYSDVSIFTFEPQLISVPTKGADEETNIIDPSKIVSTSDEGEWNYKISTVLKPGVQPRYGKLEIRKSLLTFEKLESGEVDPATFVFSVDATITKGEGDDAVTTSVYSNVVSLAFSSAGQKSVLLDNIPIGSTVTVTEVYSGANYKQVSVDPEPVIIQADEIATVEFTNDYTGTRRGGGSLTNNFEYNEGAGETEGSTEGSTEGTWNWTQLDDNSSNVTE